MVEVNSSDPFDVECFMPDRTVYLIGGEDDEAATLVAEARNGDCHIEFHFRNKVIEASASDYFEAFSRIREQLELEWTSAMRWADVPVDIRDLVRENLGDLLQQAATTPPRPGEGPADE